MKATLGDYITLNLTLGVVCDVSTGICGVPRVLDFHFAWGATLLGVSTFLIIVIDHVKTFHGFSLTNVIICCC